MSRIFRVWFCIGVILCVCGTAVAVQPAGVIYQIPSQVWSQESGTTDTTVQVMLPQKLDQKGTVTLLLQGDSDSRLIHFQKQEMPPELGFLFGESNDLYVRIFSSNDRINFEMTGNQLVVEMPYDQTPEANRCRKFRLVDTTNQPAQNMDVAYSLHGRFGAYKTPYTAIAPSADGVYALPNVLDWLHTADVGRSQPTEQYDIKVTVRQTGQAFIFDLMEFAESPVTRVMLPVANGTSPGEIKTAEATVLNPDGSPNPETTMTILQRYRAPGGTDIMNRNDPEVIKVNNTVPGPDGKIRIQFSSEFSYVTSGGALSVLLREHNQLLYPETSTTLQLGGQTQIQLPRRLDLTVTLVKSNGEHIDAHEQAWSGDEWGGVNIGQLNPDCKLTKWDLMAFRDRNSTGVVFMLKGLPVPGKYEMINRGITYGAVDVGVTSPTQVIEFHETNANGKLSGTVVDENSKPVPGALALVVKSHGAFNDLKDSATLATRLAGLQTSDGLAILNDLSSDVLSYALSDSTGKFEIPRKEISRRGRSSLVMVVAPGRIPAQIGSVTPECFGDLAENIELPVVHLPAVAYAVGVVNAPTTIYDRNDSGKAVPLNPQEHYYEVNSYRTWAWYGQEPAAGEPFWQYDNRGTTVTFGQPFKWKIPVGTSVSIWLTAPDLPITDSVMKPRIAKTPGEILEYEPKTLRAQKPFKLVVKYANGEPAGELLILINRTYTTFMVDGKRTRPRTDKNGEIILYADNAYWSPYLEVISEYRRGVSEEFKAQRMDENASLPVVTLTLDAKKWEVVGRDPTAFYD